MPNVKTLQRSFNGGEIGPEMFGQVGDAKYQSGLAKCRNFIVKPQGPIENRPGFAFVREVKDSTKKTRLIPFTYSTTQTMMIEVGAGYFRFHTMGATLLSAGSPYEVTNPYAEADLFDLHFVQSADVLTIVHPNYAPRELRRLGATNWTLTTILFSPAIAAPGTPSVTQTGATANKYTYHYVVTAIADDGVSESQASAEGSVAGNLFESGCTVNISWSAVPGALRYNVYKKQGGLYGYIGQTDGVSIVDDNIAPDLSKTPPTYDDPFLAGGAITSVPVISGGSGYTSSITGGGILSVIIPVNQYGFKQIVVSTDSATVSIVDQTGYGASITAKVAKGGSLGIQKVISSLVVVSAGAGYTNPVVTVRDAKGKVVASGLAVQISPITSTVPVLSVNDTTGSGAKVKAVVTGGAITGVTVIEGGSGYTNPTVSISSSGGSGASFGAPVVASRGDYPGAVSYFEQRRCFAGTKYKPQNIWMTKSGTESNMSYSLPIRDDDRIAFRVAAREANTIRHIVPLTQLLLLTSSAEWRVTSVNSDAITPTTISVRPQSYVGASNVQPVIINNTLLYGAARGGHVRELAYSWQANGFITGDLSLRAPHLFDTFDISDMAYSKAPQPLVWFVSSNGNLLGLTYVPEQQVGAWHWHDTDGKFESCAVVSEGSEDVLYVVVARSINGQYKRYIERMASRQFVNQDDAFFVDCGQTYSGAPASVISGLDHLEGRIVSILADGAVHPRRVVTSGQITLEQAASKVHIGLPITADAQSLPLAMQIDSAFGQGRYKNVNKAWLRVYRSSGIFVGPDADNLTEMKQRTIEPYGTPPVLKSEEMQLMLTPSWADSGQVYVRQSDPLPLTIVSMTLEVAIGG